MYFIRVHLKDNSTAALQMSLMAILHVGDFRLFLHLVHRQVFVSFLDTVLLSTVRWSMISSQA